MDNGAYRSIHERADLPLLAHHSDEPDHQKSPMAMTQSDS